MGALSEIVAELYAAKPTKTLYHYTSLTGMMGIVESRRLWATEIRYVNDSSELHELQKWLLAGRLAKGEPDRSIQGQFFAWLKERMGTGPLVFLGCFTEQGNLLSQWRGYCKIGSGVSLGFRPNRLEAAVAPQKMRIGRCIYDKSDKAKLADQVLEAVISAATSAGPGHAHPTQSYHPTFYKLEEDLLAIAALVKNNFFHEEDEWRVVSPAYHNYVDAPVKYRAGMNTLIPYSEIPLPVKDGKLALVEAIVGPTPNVNMTMFSVPMYLRKYASCPIVGNCSIPYRE